MPALKTDNKNRSITMLVTSSPTPKKKLRASDTELRLQWLIVRYSGAAGGDRIREFAGFWLLGKFVLGKLRDVGRGGRSTQ